MKINTQKAPATKKNREALATYFGFMLANSCMIKVKSNKRDDVILVIKENPFEKNNKACSNLQPTVKCEKVVRDALIADGTKGKRVIEVFTLAISDAANARKVKGKKFYMTEVRRITSRLISIMNDYNIDSDKIFRLD